MFASRPTESDTSGIDVGREFRLHLPFSSIQFDSVQAIRNRRALEPSGMTWFRSPPIWVSNTRHFVPGRDSNKSISSALPSSRSVSRGSAAPERDATRFDMFEGLPLNPALFPSPCSGLDAHGKVQPERKTRKAERFAIELSGVHRTWGRLTNGYTRKLFSLS